ncbi:MAG: UDP-N-acetylmuramoyl-tripeptide--D-alanyl-D-alanine ligase [Chloroflexi bacterium]|nr:UDP-N-acetylmuramoyl-tripeptide--D-alanyl-D-alanine ligase [Chloroflexota bacterium]
MISLTLDDVLHGVGGYSLPFAPSPNITFTDVVNDSRLAGQGALFIAFKGERDGHNFIPGAYQKGAVGVIAERVISLDGWLPEAARTDFAYIVVDNSLAALQALSAYWRRRFTIQAIGVTGSVGKTSTKEVIAAVLSNKFAVLKNEKNMNNEIGLPLSLLHLNAAHQKAVLEMGMYNIGEIATLCRISRPEIGVVTNVSHSHLERLGSIERIARAKSELVEALPKHGVAVLNGDEPLVRQMAARNLIRSVLFGTSKRCHVRARRIKLRALDGISFELVTGEDAVRVDTPLLGRHSVYPCLAAAAVGLELGLSLGEIAEGLRETPATVRLQALAGRNGSTIIDDTYNASPVSTNAALDLLGNLRGRRIAVLGDMFELGHYEEQGHRDVGRQAAKCVDRLIVVGKRARWIGEEALRAGLKQVEFAESNSEVTLDLMPGDQVLVKGSRGMRMEEVVASLVEVQSKKHR